MKKIIFIVSMSLLIVITGLDLQAQGKKVVLGSNNGNPSFLVGTLRKTARVVYEKLKIEIYGGNWHTSNLGENHYYISTRDGLKINQEIHGGSYSKYTLKVYENGNVYDFVIQVTDDYPAFFIRAWKISGSGIGTISESNIVNYDPRGKIDVTNQFPANTIFATTNSGNIGIGTTIADHKLDVNGTIRAKEIKVETNWSDFVFEKDYNLRTLEDLEHYISQNKHLPDIPSESVVKENGINLGEINAKLLQKIEELTLYVIKQNKEINNLKNQINKLEN